MQSNDLAYHRALASSAPILTREAELELARRFRTLGDRAALERLARAQLRSVVALAMKYRRYEISLSELVAEGNCGLLHALRKFDPERGVRLSTYAVHWIRAYMLAHVMRSWSVVGGASGVLRSRVFFKLRRERARIANVMGDGSAADAALAERMGVTVERLHGWLARVEARDASLDFSSEPGSPALGAALCSLAADPEQRFSQRESERALGTALSVALTALDPRELDITTRRLMAAPGEQTSLSQLARDMGVSRERVRQLEERAKTKLRRAIATLADPALKELLPAQQRSQQLATSLSRGRSPRRRQRAAVCAQ
jgi:RNA polymerase sigma-32 factor